MKAWSTVGELRDGLRIKSSYEVSNRTLLYREETVDWRRSDEYHTRATAIFNGYRLEADIIQIGEWNIVCTKKPVMIGRSTAYKTYYYAVEDRNTETIAALNSAIDFRSEHVVTATPEPSETISRPLAPEDITRALEEASRLERFISRPIDWSAPVVGSWEESSPSAVETLRQSMERQIRVETFQATVASVLDQSIISHITVQSFWWIYNGISDNETIIRDIKRGSVSLYYTYVDEDDYTAYNTYRVTSRVMTEPKKVRFVTKNNKSRFTGEDVEVEGLYFTVDGLPCLVAESNLEYEKNHWTCKSVNVDLYKTLPAQLKEEICRLFIEENKINIINEEAVVQETEQENSNELSTAIIAAIDRSRFSYTDEDCDAEGLLRRIKNGMTFYVQHEHNNRLISTPYSSDVSDIKFVNFKLINSHGRDSREEQMVRGYYFTIKGYPVLIMRTNMTTRVNEWIIKGLPFKNNPLNGLSDEKIKKIEEYFIGQNEIEFITEETILNGVDYAIYEDIEDISQEGETWTYNDNVFNLRYCKKQKIKYNNDNILQMVYDTRTDEERGSDAFAAVQVRFAFYDYRTYVFRNRVDLDLFLDFKNTPKEGIEEDCLFTLKRLAVTGIWSHFNSTYK